MRQPRDKLGTTQVRLVRRETKSEGDRKTKSEKDRETKSEGDRETENEGERLSELEIESERETKDRRVSLLLGRH